MRIWAEGRCGYVGTEEKFKLGDWLTCSLVEDDFSMDYRDDKGSL